MPEKNTQAPNIHNRETAKIAEFVKALTQAAQSNGTLDSVAAADFVKTSSNQASLPDHLQMVLDECPDDKKGTVTCALVHGLEVYKAMHGMDAPADLVQQAMHSAYATSNAAQRKYSLDSANSLHHDAVALQPNRAVVAILATLAEGIPFAHYLPADIGSNEAVLAIMSHNAGNTYGAYKEGGLMDGTMSGGSYISSSRVHESKPDGSGNITGKLTKIQLENDTCDAQGGDLKLLRGRTLVYVNGVIAAREVDSTGAGNSAISGDMTIGDTTYLISGSINTDTGDYTIKSTPALPQTVPVLVEGFIDHERAPELTPSIITAVNTYKLHAKPWRVTTHQTIDSRTQMANELGLDPYSESVIAIQTQFANERHYEILAKARRLAVNNQADHDFDWTKRSNALTRATIWQDFASTLGKVSQQMAIDTMNHGVTHLYVGKTIASQLLSLPRDLFEPSGIAERAGIFRLGRLFGRFEVYFTPKMLQETHNSAQILCIGRATDVTRNPFILGDAVPPTVLPLSMGADLKQGAGFYARNFTAVNPHKPSSLGCAMINVTNLA